MNRIAVTAISPVRFFEVCSHTAVHRAAALGARRRGQCHEPARLDALSPPRSVSVTEPGVDQS